MKDKYIYILYDKATYVSHWKIYTKKLSKVR